MTDDPKATAERMVSLYKHSKYTPAERATDHAFSYDSTDPKRTFWLAVLNHINRTN